MQSGSERLVESTPHRNMKRTHRSRPFRLDDGQEPPHDLSAAGEIAPVRIFSKVMFVKLERDQVGDH